MREPQRQGHSPSRARVRPARHIEPKTQGAVEADRRLGSHGVAGEAARILELV